MTNEEKARELFKTEVGNLDVPDFDREFEILTAIEAMAEWKDQQFKEYLEKKRDKWQSAYEETQDSDYYAVYNTLAEIINELFKED